MDGFLFRAEWFYTIRMRFALLPIVLAAVSLAGCNVVVTATPLLTLADEAGGAPLRPGVWRLDAGPSCVVDEARPIPEWPACAGGVVFDVGVATWFDHDATPPGWTHQAYVLAAGTPRIGQTAVNVGGDIHLNARPFVYAGVRATRTDPQGRVLAIELWPVQCGPPPLADATHEMATRRPLPGMIMNPGDPVCTTRETSYLRAAARASEAWTEKTMAAHWVRDGDR
ncbi:MAG: hypothetical protein ABI376_07865 [Caulobacteraceae bacterium]